jgi:ABC-type multidrug transport system fused ATPase/permease subunit
MSHYEFEEEEFTTEFNGKTVWRILKQALPHWPWLVGFLLAIAFVSGVDSYTTYLSKRIVDEGIVAGNRAMLTSLVTQYGGLMLAQSVGVFVFIYLCGMTCGRRCSSICRRYRSPTLTARRWDGSSRA